MDNENKQASAAELLNFLADRKSDMLDLLERIVNTDSNSYDKVGVDAVGTIIAKVLAQENIPVRRIALPDHGDPFIADIGSQPAGENDGHVLLMGHRDTVFPKGEATRRPFTVKDGRAYGPGVADMKAGLVINTFVAIALKRLGLPHPPIKLLFTGDEEIGTPANHQAIVDAAKGAIAVFNAEPGRISGNVVTQRRGGIFFRVRITGKAAHAGLDYEHGRSAILAIARKVEKWTAITDKTSDVTVNVGLISGGQSVNTVAPWATCEIDLRYSIPAQRQSLLDAVFAVAQAIDVDGTDANIEVIGEFLPMASSPAQEDLLATYVEAARLAGLDLTGEHTRSCADSGITATLGIPTLCATGPVGGKAHSPEEYMEIQTLVPRAQALALSILSLVKN